MAHGTSLDQRIEWLMSLKRVALALLLVSVTACSGSDSSSPNVDPSAATDVALRRTQVFSEFSSASRPLLTDLALNKAFELPPASGSSPSASSERPRGGGVQLYSSVAPAVVIVRTSDGHGSGFLVSPDGLIVTNHHVVESGLRHRANGSYAMVNIGALSNEGIMRLQGEAVEASLLKVDPANDLALLKLSRPAGAPPLPFIRLSATAPRPGTDCAIIGHPSSGMIWTYRPCQVSSVGDFPRDMVNLVVARLSASAADKAEIETFVKGRPLRRILLTSAQANPGDSGGPVVDEQGALIGVTFGGPGDSKEDKFTFHVHLEDVRRLIASPPATAMLLPPDPWNFGARVMLRDLDGDGRPDLLAAGTNQPDVWLFDLDNDTPPALLQSNATLARAINERKFDFEVALDLRGSGYISYYDTDNDGRVDLILTTNVDAPTAKERFVLDTGGRWLFGDAAGAPIFAGSHLKTPALARRLDTLRRAMK